MEMGDKKGGGLALLKMRDGSNFERMENECRDMLVVRWGTLSSLLLIVMTFHQNVLNSEWYNAVVTRWLIATC